MEINVSSAIEEILDRRETVTLVGMGSLALENLSAKVAEDGKTISPPKAKLKFYDVQTSNKPLKKYLSNKYDISKKDAEKAIKKFSQSVLNTLANFGVVDIEGIATIKQKGKKIKVSALDSYKKKYYAGLPEVPLSKVQPMPGEIREKAKPATVEPNKVADRTIQKAAPSPKTTEPVYEPPRPSTKVTEVPQPTPAKTSVVSKIKEPAKSIVSKPLAKSAASVGSITAATSGLASAIAPKKTPKVEAPKKTTMASSDKPMSLNEKLGITGDKKTPVETTTTTTKTTYVPPTPPKREKFGCLGPFLGLLGLCLLAFLLWKGFQCLTNSGSKTAASIKDKTEETITQTKDALVSESESDNEDDIDSEDVDANFEEGGSAGDNEECIIITGSYSNYQNVSKMEELLESKGYDVYVQEYGPYTRVGFTFDCAGKDLPSYLYNIRDRINAKAWYLEPELYVDYR